MGVIDDDMRTTLNLDSEIINELQYRASQDGVTVSAKANQILRKGLNRLHKKTRQSKIYKEKPIDMGIPKTNIDNALQLANALGDEELLR